MSDHPLLFWLVPLVALVLWRAFSDVSARGRERRTVVAFAAAGLLVGAWQLEGALLPEWRERRAREWTATSGTVVYSRVQTTTPGRRSRVLRNYYANVGTEFMAGGVPDTAWQVGLVREVGSSERADEIAGRYPVGASVRVYYDPERPWEAVLEREAPAPSAGRVAVGLALSAGALALLAAAWRRPRAAGPERGGMLGRGSGFSA